MELLTKTKVILGAFSALFIFAAGRYSVQSPTIKTKESIDVNTDIKKAKDTHKVTTIIKDPKTGEEITTITEDTKENTDKTKESVTKIDQTITPPKTGTVNISALGAMDFGGTFKPAYGVSVSKEFIGPITVGAFGLTNGVIGLSLGLNF